MCFGMLQSSQMCGDLSSDEYMILDELYQRLTSRTDEELHDVKAFWGRLHEYRSRTLRRSNDQAVTTEQASKMLESFKYNVLWYELPKKQRNKKRLEEHGEYNTSPQSSMETRS